MPLNQITRSQLEGHNNEISMAMSGVRLIKDVAIRSRQVLLTATGLEL